tara:strand:+ start:835 stop:1341 length:507 start_codon:yes stop_codon:yes gene_type:complete
MNNLQMSIAGTIVDGVHMLPLRVYYEDTDASGVVYHANYLRFIERGRTDLIRCLGINHVDLAEFHQLRFAVSRCELQYCSPAYLDDYLQVFTAVLRYGFATVHVRQVVRRDDIDLFCAKVRLACVDKIGRPRRFPKVVQSIFASLSDCDLAGSVPSNFKFQHLREESA